MGCECQTYLKHDQTQFLKSPLRAASQGGTKIPQVRRKVSLGAMISRHVADQFHTDIAKRLCVEKLKEILRRGLA